MELDKPKRTLSKRLLTIAKLEFTIYFSVHIRLIEVCYKGKYKTLISGPGLVSA